jgi:hypothetical protein
MFRNGTAANKYSFTGYFGAGNFKLISTRKLDSQLGKAMQHPLNLTVMLVNLQLLGITSSLLTLLH